jgi:predicted transcriptional regulator
MTPSLVDLAKELTLALVQTGNVSAEDIQHTLQETFATLAALKTQDELDAPTPEPAAKAAAVNWRKSMTKQAVTCLECGQAFKQLSLRHLRAHGLDNRSYRTKYGIPPTQPLSSRATTERRRQVAQKVRPWEKKQQLLQAREYNRHASPDLDAEAVHEVAGEPGATAPALPKRQRKISSKKTAAPKKAQRAKRAG